MAVAPTASAHDVARDLRHRIPDLGIIRTHKLLYYVQGWHLAWTGEPVFHEKIVAWENGPVVADLWHDEDKGRVAPTPIELTDDVITTIGYVGGRYGRLSARELINLTHDEDPWKNAYRGRVGNAEISFDSLVEWFSSDPLEMELRLAARELSGRDDVRKAMAMTIVDRSSPVRDETHELEAMLSELEAILAEP